MTNFNATVPDYLRVIRLGFGAGEPGGSACWMTALQAHMNGEWTDQCSCVDPVINALCIHINDSYGSDNVKRTEDIMNFGLFRVLGTKGTVEESYKRMMHLANVVIREWFLTWLQEMGVEHISPEFYCKEDVDRFRPCIDVVDNLRGSPDPLFIDILKEADSRIHRFTRTHNLRYLISFFLTVAATSTWTYNLSPDFFNLPYSSLANYQRRTWLSYRRFVEKRNNFLKDKVYPLLSDLIAMGPHGPIEQDLPVCGVKTFHEKVGVKHEDCL